MLEHPDITSALRTGYPRNMAPIDERRYPRCGYFADEEYYNDYDEDEESEDCLYD